MVKRKQKLEWKPAAKVNKKKWTKTDIIFVVIGLVLLGVYIWLN